MIGAFIYILRVHHIFHAHTTHELLGYVGGGVTPRVCYFVLLYVIIFLHRSSIFSKPLLTKKFWVYYGSVKQTWQECSLNGFHSIWKFNMTLEPIIIDKISSPLFNHMKRNPMKPQLQGSLKPLSVNWKHVQLVKIYMPCNFEVNLITRLGVVALFSLFFSSPGPCEALQSLGVRRPFVNFFIF